VDEYLENTSWEDIVEAVGEQAPRFVFIVFEIVHPDDRKSYPISMIYFSPETASTELNLLYSRMVIPVERKFHMQYCYTQRESEKITREWILGQMKK
jgi:hypothetical protein